MIQRTRTTQTAVFHGNRLTPERFRYCRLRDQDSRKQPYYNCGTLESRIALVKRKVRMQGICQASSRTARQPWSIAWSVYAAAAASELAMAILPKRFLAMSHGRCPSGQSGSQSGLYS